MSISEESRHQLHQQLDDLLGTAAAATLMAHLPPVGWADVATKRDLDHLGAALEAKLEVGLADVRTELRTSLADVRTELHREIGGLRTELHREIGGMHTELHREIGGVHAAIGSQTRSLFLGLAGIQLSGIVAVAGLSTVL